MTRSYARNEREKRYRRTAREAGGGGAVVRVSGSVVRAFRISVFG